MSAGDPNPQIPPRPDHSPEEAQRSFDASAQSEQSDDWGYRPDGDPHSSQQYGYGPAGGQQEGDAQSWGSPQSHNPQQPFDSSQPYGSQPAYGSAPTYGAAADGQSPGSGPAHTDTGSVPQPAPAPGYAPNGQAGPGETSGKKPRKSRLPLILSLSAVGVVLILVLVGALVIMNMNRTQYGPETVAQEYFDAVAAGDMGAAEDVTSATVPNGANEALLTPEIFAASAAAIEDVRIGDADIDGDTAAMTATYSLAGQEYELPLTASKNGRQGLFFDQWELQPPTLQTLSLDLTQVEGATVNGEAVDLEMGATEYAVMPGSYEVVVPETTYTQEGRSSITVGFSPDEQPQAADVAMQIGVTDEYKKDVEKAVRKKLDECLESGKLETDCGFFSRDGFETDEDKEIYDELRTDDIDFEMTEEPTIVVTDYGAATTGSFYTDDEKPGKVRAVVRTGDGDRYELTTDLMPSGTVTVEDDKIVITYFFNG